jgi:hypothetical protein
MTLFGLATGFAQVQAAIDGSGGDLGVLSDAVDAFYTDKLAAINASHATLLGELSAHRAEHLMEGHFTLWPYPYYDDSGDIVSYRSLRVQTVGGQVYYIPTSTTNTPA